MSLVKKICFNNISDYFGVNSDLNDFYKNRSSFRCFFYLDLDINEDYDLLRKIKLKFPSLSGETNKESRNYIFTLALHEDSYFRSNRTLEWGMRTSIWNLDLLIKEEGGESNLERISQVEMSVMPNNCGMLILSGLDKGNRFHRSFLSKYVSCLIEIAERDNASLSHDGCSSIIYTSTNEKITSALVENGFQRIHEFNSRVTGADIETLIYVPEGEFYDEWDGEDYEE